VRGLTSHFQQVKRSSAGSSYAYTGAAVDSPSNTVLVVDDDAAIRFLCRVNLELEGWTVREAASVAEARAAVADRDIAVVLLDVHLGAESSLDLLEELRAGHPDLPVAMLTGSTGTPTLEGVIADAVIPKPFRPDALTATVRRLAMRLAPNAG
jgi:DNA-binding NtrC family response regulator